MFTEEEKEAISMLIGIFRNMSDERYWNCLSDDVQNALISAKEKCDKN